jgi:two-component system cell cycle response regulator
MYCMKQDPTKRTIFVLNEEEHSLQLILEPLRWEGYEVKGFTSYNQFSEALRFMRPQVVIIDPELAHKDGVFIVNQLIPNLEGCSVVIVSPDATTEKITQYLDLGASDFISSPFVPLEFLARIRNQFRIQDMTSELLEANEKLKNLVEIDDLTGLFNMRSIYQKLEFEMERAKRFSRTVTVIMLDMDKFKSVNDGHDHLFGSFVISEVGKIIRQMTRAVDIPARYGGDEFLIVLSETPLSGVEFFCERLRKKVEDTVFTQGIDSIQLTLSIGFAVLDVTEDIPAKELVRRADTAIRFKATNVSSIVYLKPKSKPKRNPLRRYAVPFPPI